MELLEQIRAFQPWNPQEEQDRAELLRRLGSGEALYTRDNASAHLTASAWVVSPDRRQVLMAYHNLYGSWAWRGGHADGERDLLAVALREVREETGLNLTRYQYRGIVTFVSERWVTEYMHLFTADGWTGEIGECSEGVLEWVPRSRLLELPHWEGDAIFLDLLARDVPFFSLKLRYDKDDQLVEAVLNGEKIR